MITSYETKFNFRLIDANNPTTDEQNELITKYHVTREIINYALDKFELPRITYDEYTRSFLMVLSVPSHQQTLETAVQSVTIFANRQQIICFTNNHSQHIINYLQEFLKVYSDNHNLTFRLFADLIRQISDNFLDKVKKFYDEQEQIEMEFQHHHHRSATINQLATLQTKITFGVTATSGNADLIDELFGFFNSDDNHLKLDPWTAKHFDQARIESNQALKNFQLINEIAQQLSGTYNNLLNDETNDVMRYLTVYSLILTIPSIVVGFYGMNMHLPLANSKWSWIISIVIMLLLCLLLIIDMIRRHFL
ncbi:magnesium transporter CorA family protein [Bombilactobacillus folatiphilus]|uniref:Magnesium transporter CorA family protein n=1 Tax=Bombilactobacillus folatiphilus TaxID=2923362 RepID=A0ABY4P7A3_9LACO|nr:magnesium transporter CorA family protein [Bombilactobacillus folatiphilus]UQS81476.1 magnesium transporter CorA family protein [Bombilactobacillus folatiphilus]